MRHKRAIRPAVVMTLGIAAAVLTAGATVVSFTSSSGAPSGTDTHQSSPVELAQPAALESPSPTSAPSESSGPTPEPTGSTPSSGGSVQGGTGAQAAAGPCSDVEVVFARGTGERPGLGILGTPLASSLRQLLPNRTVTSYGVNYAAASDQSSAGPGATDMSRHISAVASQCPQTTFVIGGYSQGATVTDIAIGIPRVSRSTGETISANLASRIAAVVVFGNPLGLSGRTIETASPTYGPKAKSFCNTDDTVCGGGGAGSLPGSHLSYATNGSITQAAQFAASRI